MATSTSIHRVLAKLFWLYVATVVCSLIVPGAIARLEGVFDEQGLKQKLPELAKEQLQEYDVKLVELHAQLASLNKRISSNLGTPGSDGTLENLVKIRNETEERITKEVSPIRLLPFFPSWSNLFWPFFYFFLGAMAFVFPVAKLPTKFWPNLVCFWACILFIYRFPTWLRNIALRDSSRVVYADANWDVSPTMFIVQEVLGAGVAMLLAVIWLQCIAAAKEPTGLPKEPLERVTNSSLLSELNRRLFHWQCMSVLLVAAFLPLVSHFYNVVFTWKDYRYLFHAIAVHLIWATTWILVSLPLIAYRATWQTSRLQCLARAVTPSKVDRPVIDRESLEHINPFGAANFAASGFVALASFLWPIIQHLLPGR